MIEILILVVITVAILTLLYFVAAIIFDPYQMTAFLMVIWALNYITRRREREKANSTPTVKEDSDV